MKDMIYVACPYSHEMASVREERFQMVNSYAAWLIKGGNLVFSPISMSHPISKHGIDPHWNGWVKLDLEFLKHATVLHVLQLHGWKLSLGLFDEIYFAKRNNIAIKSIDVTFGKDYTIQTVMMANWNGDEMEEDSGDTRLIRLQRKEAQDE